MPLADYTSDVYVLRRKQILVPEASSLADSLFFTLMYPSDPWCSICLEEKRLLLAACCLLFAICCLLLASFDNFLCGLPPYNWRREWLKFHHHVLVRMSPRLPLYCCICRRRKWVEVSHHVVSNSPQLCPAEGQARSTLLTNNGHLVFYSAANCFSITLVNKWWPSRANGSYVIFDQFAICLKWKSLFPQQQPVSLDSIQTL